MQFITTAFRALDECDEKLEHEFDMEVIKLKLSSNGEMTLKYQVLHVDITTIRMKQIQY